MIRTWRILNFNLKVEEDCKNGVAGAVPIPPENSGRDSVIDAIVTNVEAMIKADRKITSLKQLQVHAHFLWTGRSKKY